MKGLMSVAAILLVVFLFGFSQIIYNHITTHETYVEVGTTQKTVNGYTIKLVEKESGKLVYRDMTETNEEKHQLTYVYELPAIEGNKVEHYEIQVVDYSNDVQIVSTKNNITSKTISITFELNHDKYFNTGELLNIHFTFKAVELKLGGFDSLNLNTASKEDLMALDFINEDLANGIMTTRRYTKLSSLKDLASRFNDITVLDVEPYEKYEQVGIIRY